MTGLQFSSGQLRSRCGLQVLPLTLNDFSLAGESSEAMSSFWDIFRRLREKTVIGQKYII